MRNARVWAGLLGLQKTVVERVEFDEQRQVLIASVRPGRGRSRRCGICDRRCAGYDQGAGRRRWRALDLAPSAPTSRRTRRPRRVLHPARTRTLRPDHSHQLGRGRLDPRSRHRTLPASHPLRRPVPRGRLGHRRPRRTTPGRLEPGPRRGPGHHPDQQPQPPADRRHESPRRESRRGTPLPALRTPCTVRVTDPPARTTARTTAREFDRWVDGGAMPGRRSVR
jgi:hypothetical protein